MGCQVTAVSSGEEALPHLERGVDILLTDLLMKGKIGGGELTARARSDEKTDVIIMTAYPDTESAVQAVKSGVFDYLVKPFNAAALRRSVERCMEKRGYQRRLQEGREQMVQIDRTYEELAWGQKIKSLYGDFWKRGEERDVTILLVEVMGFFEAVRDAPPEEKVSTLNNAINILTDAIQAEMGHLCHIQGETVHALFGSPVPLLDHAAAALRAARRMRNLWGAFSSSSKTRNLSSVGLKTAVLTGKSVVGCLGGAGGSEYGAMGPEAKEAEYLLRTARAGQILASAETVRRAEGDFRFRTQGLVIGAPYHGEVLELE
jgi:class 3 adenylate cyclase